MAVLQVLDVLEAGGEGICASMKDYVVITSYVPSTIADPAHMVGRHTDGWLQRGTRG